jgi:RNA polymerase sigma factor (sigma-70 family)
MRVLTRTRTVLLEGLKDLANREAWTEFDARYRPLLMGAARRLRLPDADGEDAVQETLTAFMEQYRAGAYAREKGRLRDWLAGIMTHKVRDVQRRRGQHEKLIRAAPPPRDADDGLLQAAIEQEWTDAVLRQSLERVRQEISPRMMESFELSALRLWPAAQVAQRLGISLDAVYQNKRRVLQRLKEVMPAVEEFW